MVSNHIFNDLHYLLPQSFIKILSQSPFPFSERMCHYTQQLATILSSVATYTYHCVPTLCIYMLQQYRMFLTKAGSKHTVQRGRLIRP